MWSNKSSVHICLENSNKQKKNTWNLDQKWSILMKKGGKKKNYDHNGIALGILIGANVKR